jgi:hypothetical protein
VLERVCLPRLKAVVIPLLGNLPVAIIQKDGKSRPHHPTGRQPGQRYGENAGPLDFQPDVLAAGHRTQDFIPLASEHLLPPFGAFQDLGESAGRPVGSEPVGELLLNYRRVKEGRELVTGCPGSDRGEIALGRLKIVRHRARLPGSRRRL